MKLWLALVAAALLAGCAVPRDSTREEAMTPAQARTLVARAIPDGVPDRAGWAADTVAAMTALGIAPTIETICAIVAVTAQESGFKVDPAVPNLPQIAWKEIERKRDEAGVPKLVLQAALGMSSSDGRSYSERLDAAKTELDLSNLYEDFIGRVPLAKRFLDDRNPVRTGGPMQVSVAFAKEYSRAYPYPVAGSIRHEVFTRRGGMYFGIAHLLDYPAPYDRMTYRFADFNAGRYASRNAAFQKAVAELSGVSLDLDGDLVRFDHGAPAKEAGSTEMATRSLATRLGMGDAEIRRDLEQGRDADFERSRLYARVFDLAEKASGKKPARGVLPRINLQSPKFTRKLTTEWFAKRVDDRFQKCRTRLAA
jgi:hypothetical protein